METNKTREQIVIENLREGNDKYNIAAWNCVEGKFSPNKISDLCKKAGLDTEAREYFLNLVIQYMNDLAKNILEEIVERIPEPEIKYIYETRNRPMSYMTTNDYKIRYSSRANLRTGLTRLRSALRQLLATYSWRQIVITVWTILSSPDYAGRNTDINDHDLKIVKRRTNGSK